MNTRVWRVVGTEDEDRRSGEESACFLPASEVPLGGRDLPFGPVCALEGGGERMRLGSRRGDTGNDKKETTVVPTVIATKTQGCRPGR